MPRRLGIFLGITVTIVVMHASASVQPAQDGKPAVKGNQANTDAMGDPLPVGAVARLGTVRFRHPGSRQYHVAISPDGKFVVTAGEFGALVHVWDAATGKESRRLVGRGLYHTLRLAFSADGSMLAAGTVHDNGTTIVVWDFVTGNEIIRCHHGQVEDLPGLGFADGGKSIVAVGQVGNVYHWNVQTGELFRKWDALAGFNKRDGFFPVNFASFSVDGTIFLANTDLPDGPNSGTGAWDVAKGQMLWHHQHGYHGQISADGKHVATPAKGGMVIYDARSAKEVKRLQIPVPETFCQILSPDSKRFLAGNADGQFQIWDTSSNKVLQDFSCQGNAIAFLPDNERILFIDDNQLFIWNSSTAKLLPPPLGHMVPIEHLSFSADQKQLISRDTSGQLLVLETTTWKEISRKLPDPGHHNARLVAMNKQRNDEKFAQTESPDNRYIAWISRELVIHVQDSAAGKPIWQLKRTIEPGIVMASRLCFSPTNRYLAAWNSDDNSVWVWDLQTGNLQRLLRGTARIPLHMAMPKFISFSPDERVLAVQSLDDPHDVQLWELSSGKVRLRLQGHQGAITALAFSPDGRWLASGSEDATVLVWDLHKVAERVH